MYKLSKKRKHFSGKRTKKSNKNKKPLFRFYIKTNKFVKYLYS